MSNRRLQGDPIGLLPALFDCFREGGDRISDLPAFLEDWPENFGGVPGRWVCAGTGRRTRLASRLPAVQLSSAASAKTKDRGHPVKFLSLVPSVFVCPNDCPPTAVVRQTTQSNPSCGLWRVESVDDLHRKEAAEEVDLGRTGEDDSSILMQECMYCIQLWAKERGN